MELLLMHQDDAQILVHCNGLPSHMFDHHLLLPGLERSPLHPLSHPKVYGQAIYRALFPEGSHAQHTLQETRQTIRLVLMDQTLDAICWEYAYGPDGYVTLDYPFVRALPTEQCIDPSVLPHRLHILAVPSRPLESSVPPLDIEGEWHCLKEIIQEVPSAITLERTRPPTLEQLRRLTTHTSGCVLHFMGHGAIRRTGSVLLFEHDDGSSSAITAQQLLRTLGETVFLIVLNACVSATPGPALFSNIAASLLQQHTPYVLGMRFAIRDDDARLFSRIFYSELAHGTSVEEAIRQVRLAFAERAHPGAIGVPILYTALRTTASGFSLAKGSPIISDHHPRLDVSVLARPEGIFQGYLHELQRLGQALTSDSRPQFITIHGIGGVGKTALAREAAERFAYAWPGGVWAISLEQLPSRALVVADLARFLALAPPSDCTSQELERMVVSHLSQQRTLLLLDNAETLIEAVVAHESEALRLASFLRETLPHPPVSLLFTSRSPLGWSDEEKIEVPGLHMEDGAQLFCQHLVKRRHEILQNQARTLSHALGGHPLSLRLLATTFDDSTLSFEHFFEAYEAQLLSITNLYKEPYHRHHTLQACIAVSAYHLTADERLCLQRLTIFHAPFFPETAHAIIQPLLSSEMKPRFIENCLQRLWQRGFLTREEPTSLRLYRLLPTIRLYVEEAMEQTERPEALLSSFGIEYAHLAEKIVEGMDDDPALITFARHAVADFERAMEYTKGEVQAYYWLTWGRIMHRLENSQRSMELTEQALAFAQGHAHLSVLEGRALTNLADLYRTTSHPQEALRFYEQALVHWKHTDSRSGEAWTYNDMALVYRAQGQLAQALALHEHVLPIRHEIGDRRGEAITLSNMATIYQDLGQPQQALELCERSLRISRLIGDRNGESATLTTIALLAQHMGETERARRLHVQALHLKRAIGDRAGEAAVLNNLSELHRITGDHQKRLGLLKQALSIVRTISDATAEATVLNNLATTYQSMGQFSRAIDLYEYILPLRRKVGDHKGEAATYNNLATIYTERGETQQALAYWEQALSLVRAIGYRPDEAMILANIAKAYQQMGQTQQAHFHYEQALPMLRETHNREGEAALLTSRALLFIERQDDQHAMELLEQALTIQQEIGHKAGEVATLNNISSVYHARKQFQDALRYNEQALTILREEGNPKEEATTLNNIAVLYSELEQPQRAIPLYEHVLSLQHAIGNTNQEAITLTNLASAYQKSGDRQKALHLFQQVLPLLTGQEDHTQEAMVRSHIATLYHHAGQLEQALQEYQQVLPLLQDPTRQQEKAIILAEMGEIYQILGHLPQSLASYEQALSIQQECDDSGKEATLLHSIGSLYRSMDKLEDALHLYTQALEILRTREDRIEEANTLNSIGEVFRLIGRFEQALSLFHQALSIFHEHKKTEEESMVLNNMALVYRQTAQPLRALDIYTRVIAIWRETGHRLHEASVLNNMGTAYGAVGQIQTALEHYRQALQIRQEAGYYAGVSTTYCNMALLLYQQCNDRPEALLSMEQATAALVDHHLPCNTAQQPVEALQHLLETMRRGESIEELDARNPILSQDQLQDISERTILVMTIASDQQADWREVVVTLLERAQQCGKDRQAEAALFTNLLALLDGKKPALLDHHLYTSTLMSIETMLDRYSHGKLPFATDLVAQSCIALTHDPQEKIAHLRSLFRYESQSTDKEFHELIQCIALALVGTDCSQLGHDLQGIYRLAWETLIIAVETADAHQHQLRMLRQSTLAVLGKETSKRGEWDHLLQQMREQAESQGELLFFLFLQKLIELVENDGQLIPSHQGLKGQYARTWKEIALYLSLS